MELGRVCISNVCISVYASVTMARSQGEDDSQVILHCFQRISMAIQRGNSSMMAARMDTVHQEVDGVQEDAGYD